jgi:hypothetical protein
VSAQPKLLEDQWTAQLVILPEQHASP